MAEEKQEKDRCAIARTIALVAEPWSFLILNELSQGTFQFSEFEKKLGINPTVLSKRMQTLTEAGFIEKSFYQTNPPRYAYTLSNRGRTSYPSYLHLWCGVTITTRDYVRFRNHQS